MIVRFLLFFVFAGGFHLWAEFTFKVSRSSPVSHTWAEFTFEEILIL